MTSPAKESVQRAFLELLEERSLRDITVKDIVQRCGVNRNTFYYHFKDIPALLRETVSECANALIVAHAPSRSLSECLESAAQFALEHRQAVLHISQSAHRELFERDLLDICRRVVEDYAQAAFGGVTVPPEDREVLIRFFQCECFGQIVAWMNSGMRYDMPPSSGESASWEREWRSC